MHTQCAHILLDADVFYISAIWAGKWVRYRVHIQDTLPTFPLIFVVCSRNWWLSEQPHLWVRNTTSETLVNVIVNYDNW